MKLTKNKKPNVRKNGSRSRYIKFSIAIIVIAGIAVLGALHLKPSSALIGDLVTPFAANSPFNVPIPSNPTIDPKSGTYVSEMLGTNSPSANTTDYSNAIYDDVTPSTPHYIINITNDSRNGGNWGSNVLYGVSVPVPNDAAPPPGTDGTVVVVDKAAGKAYYFWQFQRTASGITSTWPAVFDLNGFGNTANPNTGKGTGAGISQLAGTIRVQEMTNGSINHALAFAANASLTCSAPNNGTSNPNGQFRWPAVATDGKHDIATYPNCLPYGMRVQLDPSINFDNTSQYPNLAPGERIIAKAMQKYGAYLVDSGGGNMSLSFETNQSGEKTWCQLGIAPAGSWGCPTPTDEANYWSFPWMDGHLHVLADCQCGTTPASTPMSSITPTPAPTASPTPTPTSSQTPAPLLGDLDGDHHITGHDVALLLINWNKTVPPNTGGDLDGNGIVNGHDVALMLINWGK